MPNIRYALTLTQIITKDADVHNIELIQDHQ